MLTESEKFNLALLITAVLFAALVLSVAGVSPMQVIATGIIFASLRSIWLEMNQWEELDH